MFIIIIVYLYTFVCACVHQDETIAASACTADTTLRSVFTRWARPTRFRIATEKNYIHKQRDCERRSWYRLPSSCLGNIHMHNIIQYYTRSTNSLQTHTHTHTHFLVPTSICTFTVDRFEEFWHSAHKTFYRWITDCWSLKNRFFNRNICWFNGYLIDSKRLCRNDKQPASLVISRHSCQTERWFRAQKDIGVFIKTRVQNT